MPKPNRDRVVCEDCWTEYDVNSLPTAFFVRVVWCKIETDCPTCAFLALVRAIEKETEPAEEVKHA